MMRMLESYEAVLEELKSRLRLDRYRRRTGDPYGVL